MAPRNRLALASVMMKALTPVLTMAKPFSQPSAPPRTSAAGEAERDRQAEVLEQEAGRHHRADADRADREVHAAGREHHHLREADDDIDGERAAEREEVEGREEARRQRREDEPEAPRRWPAGRPGAEAPPRNGRRRRTGDESPVVSGHASRSPAQVGDWRRRESASRSGAASGSAAQRSRPTEASRPRTRRPAAGHSAKPQLQFM